MLFDTLKDLFGLGQKEQPPLPPPVEGVPARDQWYRLVSTASREVVGHSYVCKCGTEYRTPSDIFGWEKTFTCGSHQEFCLKTFLERAVQQARLKAEYKRVGLSPNPTPLDLEKAKSLGKRIKASTKPITEAEVREAYQNLPTRYATQPKKNWPSGFVETWDEKLGGAKGEFEYEAAALDDTSTSFADPMACRKFGTFPGRK